nr:tectonic-3-like isoform X1 [Onthophagus taurus]
MEKIVFFGFVLFGIVFKVFSGTSTTNTESTTEIITSEITNDYENDNVTLEFGIDDNSTCDENCTTLTTVKTGSSPTKAPTTIKPNVKVPKISLSSSTKTCFCNIQEKVCDINCCCDKDCNYDMRQVFGKCDDDLNRVYDTSFCEYTKYIYKNNTPFEWTVNQNGFFCVAKTNLPRQYYIHKDIVIISM